MPHRLLNALAKRLPNAVIALDELAASMARQSGDAINAGPVAPRRREEETRTPLHLG
jgi:hypothetical protein